jgi:hypothetical protein
MEATQPVMPAIVHKTILGKVQAVPFDDDAPPLTDDQIEILADVLAQIRIEFRDTIDDAIAPLRERIAVLEGQISILTSLLGSDSSRSFEASETIRRLHMRG